MKNNNQKFGDLGQHWTPDDVVQEMVDLIGNTKGLILEPTAGSGQFVKNIVTNITLASARDIKAIEIDASVIPEKFKDLYTVCNFFDYEESIYTTIIGNPPYVHGKLVDKRLFANWDILNPVTANLYLHVIDKCVRGHMKKGSELIFIVPDSFINGTSKGSKIREYMALNGAFTHIMQVFPKWENASVSCCVFRYVMGAKQGKVITTTKHKELYHSDGLYYLIDYSPVKRLKDYFDVTVGAAPKKDLLDTAGQSFIKDGKLLNYDVTDPKRWPRWKKGKSCHKILVLPGPTRKKNVFYDTTKWNLEQAQHHLDHALIPKKACSKKDMQKLVKILNAFVKQHEEDLCLRIDGRWQAGIKTLQNLPISHDVSKELDSIFDAVLKP